MPETATVVFIACFACGAIVGIVSASILILVLAYPDDGPSSFSIRVVSCLVAFAGGLALVLGALSWSTR